MPLTCMSEANIVPTLTAIANNREKSFVFIRMYPKSVSGATSMPQEAVDYLGCLISYVRKYTQKSVKSVCSSRSMRASQSPLKVEKQPKSTPDMQTLPPIERARTNIYISARTFIVVVRTFNYEFCEDSIESQTTSINAFLCYVLNYYAVEFSGLGLTSVAMDAPIYASVAAVKKNSIFKFRLQSYVKKMIFANFRGR